MDHICSFKKTKTGYRCECGLFINRDQAAISLSFAKCVMGDISGKNKTEIYEKFDSIVKGLTRRLAD